jgi:hypothetical protein
MPLFSKSQYMALVRPRPDTMRMVNGGWLGAKKANFELAIQTTQAILALTGSEQFLSVAGPAAMPVVERVKQVFGAEGAPEGDILSATLFGQAAAYYEHSQQWAREGQTHPAIYAALCLARQAWPEEGLRSMDVAKEATYYTGRTQGSVADALALIGS